MSYSDNRWKAIIRAYIEEYQDLSNKRAELRSERGRVNDKYKFFEIRRQINDLNNKIEDLLESLSESSGKKNILKSYYLKEPKSANNCRFLYSEYDNKIFVGGNNNRIKVKDTFENIRNGNYDFNIVNNEILIKNKPGKILNVNSLIINLEYDESKNIIEDELLNIAKKMKEIVDFQLKKGLINIPFRDGKDKTIRRPYLFQLVEKIRNMCEEKGVNLPDDYPETKQVVEKCIKFIEDKIQKKINEIFEKDKRCYFRQDNHKLMNERSKYKEHYRFIKEKNYDYKIIIEMMSHKTNEIDKGMYYIECMKRVYEDISEYHQALQEKTNKKPITNEEIDKNSLTTTHRRQREEICCKI